MKRLESDKIAIPPSAERANDTALELYQERSVQRAVSEPIHLTHGITLELPEYISEIDEASASSIPETERSNQKRLFAIREFIGRQEGGAEFTWLPQAIEAFLRAQRSSFLPDIGRARGLSIRPDLGTVTFITINQEGLATPFDLRMDELRPYSLELTVAEAEAERALPAIDYSAEMVGAIAGLAPDAQLRWNLITRAARLRDEKVIVKPVTSDMMIGQVEGMGVFVKNGRPDDGRWSLAKVTFDDLPLTDREKKLLDGVRTIYQPAEQDPALRKFTDFVWQLVNELEARHQVTPRSAQDWTQKAQYTWKRFWGRDISFVTAHELMALTHTLLEVQQENFGIMSQVQALIMRNKGTFATTAPFETNTLPPAIQAAMEKGAAKMATVLQELITLIRKAQTDLLPLLEKAGPVQHSDHPSDPYSTERHQKITDGLRTFNAQNLTGHIKGLLE